MILDTSMRTQRFSTIRVPTPPSSLIKRMLPCVLTRGIMFSSALITIEWCKLLIDKGLVVLPWRIAQTWEWLIRVRVECALTPPAVSGFSTPAPATELLPASYSAELTPTIV